MLRLLYDDYNSIFETLLEKHIAPSQSIVKIETAYGLKFLLSSEASILSIPS